MKEHSPHQVIEQALKESPGHPVYVIRSPWPRGDRNLPIEEFYPSLIREGERLGPIDKVDIGEGRNILVFSTCAGSPHTPLRVPYEEFDTQYRKQAQEHGIDVPNDPLVQIEQGGEEAYTPDHIPLDMIMWTVLENAEGEILPVDLNDFASTLQEDQDGTIDSEAPENKFKLQLSEDKIIEIFTHIHRRGDVARKTFLSLFNNNIRSAFTIETPDGPVPILPEKKLDDILQGIAVGYYRGDKLKGYEQFYKDHLGKGSPSASAAHGRTTAHIPMDVLNMLNIQSAHASLDDIMDILRSNRDYFDTSIDLVNTQPDLFSPEYELRSYGGTLKHLIETVDPYDLLKLIDPYATLASEVLGTWFEDQFREVFGSLALDVRRFQHNAGDYERELRLTEGVEVVVAAGKGNTESKARMYARAVQALGQRISPMWSDVREFIAEKAVLSQQEIDERTRTIQYKHNLPSQAIQLIGSLKPTERQLNNLLEKDLSSEQKAQVQQQLIQYRFNFKKQVMRFNHAYDRMISGNGISEDLTNLISSLQYLQLFDSDWNQGYNIPGVPSFAITHNRLGDEYHMKFGFLFSLKGLSEAWLGGSLKRAT